jgi:hypothetical protein
MKKLSWVIMFLIPIHCQAADDPTVTLDNANYNEQMCIQNTANDCVNTVCLNSEDLDCTDKCEADAEEKCKAPQ